jgi:hypothetical protein
LGHGDERIEPGSEKRFTASISSFLLQSATAGLGLIEGQAAAVL